MAITVRTFTGFETGGLDEAQSTAGAPTVQSTVKRTGTYALSLDSGDSYEIQDPVSQSSGIVFGIGFYKTSDPLTDASVFFTGRDNGLNSVISLGLNTDGSITLVSLSGTLGTSAVLSNDTFYYIEVYFVFDNSGAYEWFINGVSQGSGTTDTFISSIFRGYLFQGVPDATVIFDDMYHGLASAASDRLSNGQSSPWVEVIGPFQNTAEDGTDVGNALDDGTWALVSETPVNEGASNDAAYTGTPRSGSTTTDEGTRLGPNGDTRFIYGTLSAAKWAYRLKRGGGASSTHAFLYGNSAGGTTGDTVTLTTSYVNHFKIKTTFASAAGDAPTTSQSFAQGLSVTGAQDIVCAEIWAFLLQQRSTPAFAFPFMSHYPVPVRQLMTMGF